MDRLCEYGCGRRAEYYFPTVDKWCCSRHWSRCPAKRKENSMRKEKEWKDPDSGLNSSSRAEKISEANKNLSEETRKRNSESHKGQIPWNKGKTGVYSEEVLGRISKANKLTIEKIKEKYKFFSQIEEMRYNPDKLEEKEIQVHCKNHLCENSKEKDGWFTPTPKQIQGRRNCLVNESEDKYNFYCSQRCKDICPIYNSRSDPFKNNKLLYTQAEYNTFIKEVLKRQKEEYDCSHNFCEKCYSTENLHVHHEKPVKTHPHLVLDPDNGIVLCEKCHYKYGHKTGSECSTGALANKVLLGCTLGGQE